MISLFIDLKRKGWLKVSKAKKMFEQLGYEFEKEYTSDGVNDT